MNICAAGILAGFIQLVIFPFLSKRLSINEFGVAVTLYGFSQLLTVVMGNTINNIRLIYNKKIVNAGNFSTLLFVSLFLAGLASIVLNILYSNNLNIIQIVILMFWTILSCSRAYLTVYYRIHLKYFNILLVHIVLICGYMLGIIIFNITGFWTVIFLIGELIANIYLLVTTPFLSEKITIDDEFNYLLKETKNLTFSNMLVQSMNYLDRFLISPMLGSSDISFYYSVSIFSKLISLVINPFNNVILSYLHKIEKNFKKIFILYNIGAILILIPGYFVIYLLTPLMLRFFYPEFSHVSLFLVALVSLSTVLNLLSTIINPFILKFRPMVYQTRIQLVFAFIYIVTALILISLYGLEGFAISSCISFFIKWLLLVYVGLYK